MLTMFVDVRCDAVNLNSLFSGHAQHTTFTAQNMHKLFAEAGTKLCQDTIACALAMYASCLVNMS